MMKLTKFHSFEKVRQVNPIGEQLLMILFLFIKGGEKPPFTLPFPSAWA